MRITPAAAGRVFHGVQPGLAPWEAPTAEPDRSSATPSLCADTPARLRRLGALRAALPGALLYRVLDLETHAVAQALGDPARVGEIATRLDGWAVPRLAEAGEAPVRINAWA